MARHPRLVIPGVALHVRQRGNDRQKCFQQDSDRLVYLSLLGDYARLRQCAIHAYCLMPNHVHLLITPADDRGLALLMRDLGRCYAAFFNRRYEKMGALWEHPFRSCLVESARYVLACYRYIELNPLRAQMVQQPAAYPWSSYAGNTNLRHDQLLTPHAEYLAIGLDQPARLRAYHQLFLDAPQIELTLLREATNGGYPLVGDRLKAALESKGARLEARPRGPRMESSQECLPGQLGLLTK
jgi:putative transposase